MCSRLMQSTPRSLAACAASDMLRVFVLRIENMERKGSSQAFQLAVSRLLQSGLLHIMSGMLAATAEDLWLQQAQPRHGAAVYWSADKLKITSTFVEFQQRLLQHASNLLSLWATLFTLSQHAGGSNPLADQLLVKSRAESAPAVLQLCATTLELASQQIPQLLAADRRAVWQAVQSHSPAVLPTVTSSSGSLIVWPSSTCRCRDCQSAWCWTECRASHACLISLGF